MNSKNNRGYMTGIDELVEQTPLDLVLSHYGLPPTGNGDEYRMKCVFNEACSDSQYGNLSVKLDAAKRIFSHCCGVKGNLLTLLHGLETQQPPTGGRLRGQEFKNAVAKLKEINGVVDSPPQSRQVEKGTGHDDSSPDGKQLPNVRGKQNAKPAATSLKEKPAFNINVPMHRHEKEAAQELADLHEDLVVDIAQMSPEAATYVRNRESWMTPELMQKWGCGWIPGNGRSLFRKNYFVYTHRNTRGEVVSYSGRDLNFETKWEKWINAGKPEGKKPNKHRYVSGFKRGAELYGGFTSRLEETHIKESLEQNGLVVVEGMNDVIRLDEMGVCAVGLCSNKATEQQIEMLTKFAQKVANSRLVLFPDQDDEGKAGFKHLLWDLNEKALNVNVNVYCPELGIRQPEELRFWS